MKLLPEKEVVYLIGKDGIDSWGLPTQGSKTKLKCYIKSSEDNTGLESKGGKQIVPTHVVSFNGAVSIKVGDLLEVEGEVKEVLKRAEIKDLSRNVLVTKVTV